jgi:hypothetical protein
LILSLLACAAVAAAAPNLKYAVKAGDTAQVAALLDKGADVNGVAGAADMTPLKLAITAHRLDMAKFLVERGADVNIRRNGTSALSLACIAGDFPAVEFLISKGAEVSPRELAWTKGADKEKILAALKAVPAKAAAAAAPKETPLSDVDQPAYQRSPRPDDYALVIGVEAYLDGPAVPYAERDAQAVRRHLVALGWPERNVLVLTGKAAGRAGMEKYLEKWLPNNVTGNSRLFFYFSGAGAVDADGRACLLPWDGDAAMLDATGYPLERLWRSLNALKGRSTIAVIDAGFPGAKADPGARELGDAVALLAASAGQTAGRSEATKHGALTYAFLKAIADREVAADAAVHPPTIKGVFDTVRAALTPTQTPRLLTGSLGESDLSFR